MVITNLECVRNSWTNPTRPRENIRHFANAIFDMLAVQTGRKVPEDYVAVINYILKKRARRYLTAPQKEWLYPECHLKTTMWDKLGDRFFLMPDPRKVSFTTGIYVGYEDGSTWAGDEYGRIPKDDDPKTKTKRDAEWETFEKAKRSWDGKFGPLSHEERDPYL